MTGTQISKWGISNLKEALSRQIVVRMQVYEQSTKVDPHVSGQAYICLLHLWKIKTEFLTIADRGDLCITNFNYKGSVFANSTEPAFNYSHEIICAQDLDSTLERKMSLDSFLPFRGEALAIRWLDGRSYCVGLANADLLVHYGMFTLKLQQEFNKMQYPGEEKEKLLNIVLKDALENWKKFVELQVKSCIPSQLVL